MRFPRHIDRLSLKVGTAIAGLLLLAMVTASYLVYRSQRRSSLAQAREHAATQTYLIRLTLEHQMLQKDRRLIRKMVQGLGRERQVQRVMILDRRGRVKFTSDPRYANQRFRHESATCQGCHRGRRSVAHGTVVELSGGTVLRGIEPIPNRPACHSCHDPKHRYNGLIVVDVPVHRILKRLQASLLSINIGIAITGLLLLAGILLLVRRLITRRLNRFERTARRVAQGDLTQRLPEQGNDALTRVERQFNQMTEALGRSLDRVREHRRNLENVMNSVDDGVVVLDPDRRIIAANNAFRRRFPDARDDLIGRRCCAAVDAGGLGCHCDADHKGQCPALTSFHTRGAAVMIRVRHTPTGEARHEEVVASPVYDADSDVTQVVEVWRDITERRSAEARLAEYQRMVSLGMLASGFSHEVNTPLGSISTCLDGIVSLPPEAPPDAKDWARVLDLSRIAVAQVERCGALTRQFLQLARGHTPTRDIVDLRESARSVVTLSRLHAESTQVEVTLEEPSAPVHVLANAAAVQQVLLNLVLNAIEASEPGQTVRIDFEEQDGPGIRVRDEGRGIEPADLPQIFEPFFTRRAAGTGLGLFVSMNLAKGWSGDIQAHSQPGTGTTFRVLFPET